MAHIDPQTRHETVDLLGDLQKANGTEEPDQHIPRDRFLAGRGHLGLHLRLGNGKGRDRKRDHEHQHGRQRRCGLRIAQPEDHAPLID